MRRYCKEDTDLDLTSMADMMLLLLIFFIVTSSFIPLYNIQVKLPVVKENFSKHPSHPLEIVLDKRGNIIISGKRLKEEEVVPELFLKFGDDWKRKEILLRVDRGANAGSLIRLIDNLHREGVEKLNVLGVSEK